MRLTLVSNIFPPAVGGPATHVFHLAESLHQRGHAVRVIAGTDDPAGAVKVPYPLVRVSWSMPVPIRYLRVMWHTWRAALQSDVVYINGIELPASLGALLAGRPRVLKVVGDWAWESAIRRGLTSLGIEPFQTAAHGLKTRVFRAIQRFYCRLASVVVVPSAYVGSLVEGWGVDARKTQVIQNALTSTPRPNEEPEAARQGLGLRAPVICNVSRLYAWKHVDALIRMVPRFDHGAALLIVGGGPEQSRLEQLAREVGVTDRVVFTGDVPHDRVATYLRASQICVLNTQYEGLSHTLVEARHVGTPIVTTDVGGNREILRHEHSAVLVPFGDEDAFVHAVNDLLADPAHGARLAQAAQTGLEHFRWDRLVDQTLEVLRDAIDRRPGAARAVA